jgi:diguanylate cyclase (GGDEF)-like protein
MNSRQRLATASPVPEQHGFAFKLLELLAIPTFVVDVRGKVILWNRACERLTGVPAYQVLGTAEHWRCFYDRARPTAADLLLQGRSADAPTLYERWSLGGERGQSLCAENWCLLPRTGHRRYLAVDASPVQDSEGRMIAAIETVRDMTEEKQARLALEQLATRDALTGLANRRCFDETLHGEWQRAQRHQQPLSLLMVDVDNFKQYNDAYGHVGGDTCLQRIATAVASEMRANDLVARYGGEEFAVVLPNQSLKGAAIVAERIRCRVEALQLPNLGTGKRVVTVSIGAATALPAPESLPAQLVATADAALYRAKHMGRNRISLPESDADQV